MDGAEERRKRAEQRRRTASLHRTVLARVEPDPSPLRGPEAVSLVAQLTRESWSAASLATPDYSRADTPYRFAPRRAP